MNLQEYEKRVEEAKIRAEAEMKKHGEEGILAMEKTRDEIEKLYP